MKLELTEAEHELLATLLQERQRELLHEISKTDSHEFRRTLQGQEQLLETLLAKLAAESARTAA